MSTPLRIVLLAAAAVAAGWLAWRPIRSWYLEPRAEKIASIASLQKEIKTARGAIAERPRIAEAIGLLAARTLGGDLETVDHRLRSHLSRVGEEIGLKELSVGTGRARALESPAASEFRNKELRQEIDGIEVEAWISGRGTLEQALRTVHRLESEPWLKRLGQVRLQADDNGASFQVAVRLATLFLPGRTPQEAGEWTYDPASFATHQPILARDPFTLRPKAAAPAPPAPPRAAGPPAFPYGDWMVTGVALLPGGPEVWLRQARSGETRRLAVGESIGELVLVTAGGDEAEFTRGEARFRAVVGQSLGAAAR